MTFSTWQLILILTILVSGVIVANVFAPGAVATVAAIATTLVAGLFVTRKGGGPPDPPAGEGGAPLKVIAGGLAAVMVLCSLAIGCAAFADIDKAQDANAKKLEGCRGEARAAFYGAHKSEDESLAIYDACVARGSK